MCIAEELICLKVYALCLISEHNRPIAIVLHLLTLVAGTLWRLFLYVCVLVRVFGSTHRGPKETNWCYPGGRDSQTPKAHASASTLNNHLRKYFPFRARASQQRAVKTYGPVLWALETAGNTVPRSVQEQPLCRKRMETVIRKLEYCTVRN